MTIEQKYIDLIYAEVDGMITDEDRAELEAFVADNAEARALLEDLVRLRNDIAAIEALKGLRSGTVRVATVESVSVEVLPTLLAGFHAELPGISVELEMTGSDAVTARVLAREADMGFTFNPASLNGLEIAFEDAKQIGAIVSPEHSLADRDTVSLAECLEYPYAWPSRGRGPAAGRRANPTSIPPMAGGAQTGWW